MYFFNIFFNNNKKLKLKDRDVQESNPVEITEDISFTVLRVNNIKFKYMEKNAFIMLYKLMVRPHLESTNLE